MALAVEEECQNKIKNNLKNIEFLQEKLKLKNEEFKKLECENFSMKKKIECYELELENLRKERELLEKNLRSSTSEKKSLNDKINNFLLIGIVSKITCFNKPKIL